jgi:hypothetical protein
MILSNMDISIETRGVFLDISGVSDSVPHYLLMKKLHAHGIRGNLFDLLKSYLTNRCLRVKIEGSFSDYSSPDFINSGVPQGSILGSLFFLISINDLNDIVVFTYMQMTVVYFAL